MQKARLEMIFSMVVFGTIAVFVRSVPLSSGEVALCRAVLAALLIGTYLATGKSRLQLSALREELPLLAVSGVAMGLNWILLFEAYRYTTVSVATLSYSFAPVLVTAACPVLFKEKLTTKQLICFVMSTLGVVCIVGVSGFRGSGTDWLGVLLGLGAAVLYASVILLNKRIRGVTGIQRTFLQFLAAVVILLPYVFSTSGLHLDRLDGKGWHFLLIIGFVHTGITYCLYFTALKEMRGQEAAILSYIDPLVAVVISVTLLHEPLSPLQAVGGALILGFAILNEKSAA